MPGASHGAAALAVALLPLPRAALGQGTGPVFVVESGACRVAGRCLTSPGWPLTYPSDGFCVVTLPETVELHTLTFSTEQSYDKLTIGGTDFSGPTGPALASANGTIRWRSDSSMDGAGFVICAGLPCGGSTCKISDVGAAMCSIPSCSGGGCGGHVPLPDGGLCSDGAATTARGTCASGTCATELCPVLRPLTTADHCPSSCLSLPKCSAQGASAANTHGTVCLGDGWCSTIAEDPGVSSPCCRGGMAYSRVVLCGGGNCSSTQCSTVSCDAATNTCVHSPVAAGVQCDDGNSATAKDECDGAGGCKGSQCRQYRLAMQRECPSHCDLVPQCGELGNVCRGDGTCGTTASVPGAPCCAGAGGAVYIAVELCGDLMCSSSPCQTASCGTGRQCANNLVPTGTPCDDGNAGTVEDVCTQGACTGRPLTTTTTDVFQVTSGPCNVTHEGLCITSPNYPKAYGVDEFCAISLAAPAMLRVVHFSTTAGDEFVVNGRSYTNSDGPSGVMARDRIEWGSDSTEDSRFPHSWQVCAAVFCGGERCPDVDSQCSLPACGPAGSCTTRNTADGKPCVDKKSGSALAECVQGQCLGVHCPLFRPALPSECPTDCAALPICSRAGSRVCRGTGSCGTSVTEDNCCGSADIYVEVVTCGGQLCSAGQCHDADCHESGTGCGMATLPDGTQCDDGQFGTVGDTCRAGSCNGTARNVPPGNFTVISGPCEVTDGGACLQSSQYPESYGSNEWCEVQVSAKTTPLKVVAFDTERKYDILTVNGEVYHGTDGPERVTPEGTIWWQTDAYNWGSGWRICQTLWCNGAQCDSGGGECLFAACGADGACAISRAQEGTPCDDGDPATSQDRCGADGKCAGQPCPLLRAALADECPTDCSALAPCSVANRSMCRGDGSCGETRTLRNCCGGTADIWVGVEECAGTTCSGGRCHEARCADGGCSLAPLPAGTPCDDGNAQTTADECSADGICKGSGCPVLRPVDPKKGECPMDCSSLPPCRNITGPLCKGDGWCGTATTTPNCCGGAAVVYLKQVDCSPAGGNGTLICDATQCTTPQCGGAECGSQALEDGTPCDDGNFGTTGDSCSAGKCVGSPRSAPPGRFRSQGPCAVQEEGRCVTSPNYPQPHGHNELCVIKVENPTPLLVESFNTEENYDFVTVDGIKYSGIKGPQGVLPRNRTLVWESDVGIATTGWRICQSLYCGGKECDAECFSTSCGADGGCPTEALPEGTPCDDGDAATTNDTCRVVRGRTRCMGSRPAVSFYRTRTNVFCSEFTSADNTATWLASLTDCRTVCDQRADCIGCSYNCMRNNMGGAFVVVTSCTEQDSSCGSYVRYKVTGAPNQAGECEPVAVGPQKERQEPKTITTDVAYAQCDSPVTIDNRLNTDFPNALDTFTVSVNGTQITVTRVDGIGGEGPAAKGWAMNLRICCRQSSVADDFEFTEGHYCGEAANANHLPESSWEGFTLNSCAAACGGSADCTHFAISSPSAIGSTRCVQYGKGDTCVLTASPDWDLYTKGQQCQDDNSFRDQHGYPCVQWVMRDCSRAAEDWGYSFAGEAEIIERCPLSCGWCQGCPWATPTDKVDVIECNDGSLSQPGDWGFCVSRGKRRRCPSNLPHMCAAVDCAGYGDHCCEADCAMKGGLRHCPGTNATIPYSGNASLPAGGQFKRCGDSVGDGEVCGGHSLNVGGVCTCANGTICCGDTACAGLFGRVCIPHYDECDALQPCGSGQICNDPHPYLGATEGDGAFRCFCESDLRRVATGGPATCDGPCLGWRQTGACSPDGPREPGKDKGCDASIDSGSSGYCECESSGRRARRVGLECGHDVSTCAQLCNPCHGVACPAPPCHSAVECDMTTGRCPVHPILADGTECTDPVGTATCVAGVCLGSSGSCGHSCLGIAADAVGGQGWSGAPGADARCAVAACRLPDGAEARHWRVSNKGSVSGRSDVSRVSFTSDAGCSQDISIPAEHLGDDEIQCSGARGSSNPCSAAFNGDAGTSWVSKCQNCHAGDIWIAADFGKPVVVRCAVVEGDAPFGSGGTGNKAWNSGLVLESSDDGEDWKVVKQGTEGNQVVNDPEGQCGQRPRPNGYPCYSTDQGHGELGRCYADPQEQLDSYSYYWDPTDMALTFGVASRCRSCSSLITTASCTSVPGCFWKLEDDAGKGACQPSLQRFCSSPADKAMGDTCAEGSVFQESTKTCECAGVQRCCRGAVCGNWHSQWAGAAAVSVAPRCVDAEFDECTGGAGAQLCHEGQECIDPKPWAQSLHDWICRCPGEASARWAEGGNADCVGPCLGFQATADCRADGHKVGGVRNCSTQIGEGVAGYCLCEGGRRVELGCQGRRSAGKYTTCAAECGRCAGVVCGKVECHSAGACDPQTGRCARKRLNGTLCGDGSGSSKCVDGVCAAVATCSGAECLPAGPCFTAACDTAGQCAPRARRADGQPCGFLRGEPGLCLSGVCVLCSSLAPLQCGMLAECAWDFAQERCRSGFAGMSTPPPYGGTGVSSPPSSGPTWGDAWMLAIGVGAVLALLAALGVCYWLRKTRAGRLVMLRNAAWNQVPAGAEDVPSPHQAREMGGGAEVDMFHDVDAQPQRAARASSGSPPGGQTSVV